VTRATGTGARHRRREHVLGEARVVLVRPRYPENLGAVARAMRTTGFSRLTLVAPLPLACAQHEGARKMAVGATHILDDALVFEELGAAVQGAALVVGTSSRHGLREVMTPREASAQLLERGAQDGIALVFGGEREGLRRQELARCTMRVRIPMVANEPSLNLAQAVMIVLYELMVAALERQAPAVR
jgi:TrmH family RNA methyltransferase